MLDRRTSTFLKCDTGEFFKELSNSVFQKNTHTNLNSGKHAFLVEKMVQTFVLVKKKYGNWITMQNRLFAVLS